MITKKQLKIIYILVLIIPSLSIYFISESTISSYKESLKTHQKSVKLHEEKLLKHVNASKDKELDAYIQTKKENGKKWLENMELVFAKKYSASQVDVKNELEKMINIAYKYSHDVNKKYKKKRNSKKITNEIKLRLSQIKRDSEVFLVDYRGNTLFGANSQEDINARTILLEEIQKVRRRGGGYIISDIDLHGTKRHILVKDLGIYKLFIGADMYVNNNNKILKEDFLDIVKNALIEESDCIKIVQNNLNIYSSGGCSDITNEVFAYESYFKAIDWKLRYSFDDGEKSQREIQKLKSFESQLKYVQIN